MISDLIGVLYLFCVSTVPTTIDQVDRRNNMFAAIAFATFLYIFAKSCYRIKIFQVEYFYIGGTFILVNFF